MPGIVGIITKMPSERAVQALQAMVGTIRHDRSYTAGTWIDERLGVYVGWAARKGSFADGMPVVNERGDVVLVFSGEEYPDPGLAEQLRQHGHRFESEGPSYLVHTYEDSPTFPLNLNGRFQGLLTDQAQGTSILFNDRYGMGRIYFHEAEDAFYFAAEAKAILAVRPELRKTDPRGLGEFVACGCVLENRTLFQDIHVLPGGSAWRFRNGVLEERTSYFRPEEWEEQSPLEPEAYYKELQSVFSQNSPRYFAGRERVGISLTGGLDTRMVMAYRTAGAGETPCYSFGGMIRECQDVILARKIAQACEQPYQVISVDGEFLSKFCEYAERTVYLTDGCTEVRHAPDLFANERASTIAPVRMTGNYGSEVLRGTRAFKPVRPTPGLFDGDFLENVDTAQATYNNLRECHPVSFAAFRQAPWHHYGLLALEQTQVAIRSPFLDNDLVRTVFRAPPSSLEGAAVSLRLIADGDKSLLRIRTDRGLAGENQGIGAALLHNLLEFAAKAEYAYDYGMPQWLARIDRRIARLHPERLFLGRHKFCHFRLWYRDRLRGYVKEMLLDERTLSRPYLERKAVREMVQGHTTGERNHTLGIHKVLTLELIHRLFID